MNDLADKVNSGKTPLGGEAVYSSHGILFIRSQNVTNDQLKLENPVFIPEVVNAQMKNSVVKADDILLNITGASLGRSCVVPKDFEIGNVNQHVCIIRLNNQADPRFVQPIFSSDKGQSLFTSLQTGSGREGLNFESIKGIKLYIPECIEQKKIASFLALLNSRIQTQNKIIEHNKSLIKGTLKCTCLTSKTWKRQYLKEILIERKETNKEQHPVFSVSVSRGLINQIEYLGRSFAAKNIDHYNVANFGDIVYTKSPTGNFPYGIIKQSFVSEKVAISPLYAVYEPKSIDLGIILHYHFNDPINVSNYLHRIIQKGAKNTISVTNQQFLNNEVFLPTDKNEIKNLAKLLQVLKNKIEIEETILDKLIKQKQYFLQQMFI